MLGFHGLPEKPGARRGAFVAICLALLLPALGCSIRGLAINGVADALARSSDLFSTEEDPELARAAVPFGLKTIEGLLDEVPEHVGLLLSACSGFTQYSFAFVETDADLLQYEDYEAAKQLRTRARKLYLRARDYGLRGLELSHPGLLQRLTLDPGNALAGVSVEQIDLLYWTGAAWGGAISLGKDSPDLIADLPAVTALMRRVMELDESYGEGAVHEVFIVLESLGFEQGSSERAREHYDRAVELSGGHRASAHLTLATNVSIANQDREEFEALLRTALSIDVDENPPFRLHNLISQRRARHLLENIDELFI